MFKNINTIQIFILSILFAIILSIAGVGIGAFLNGSVIEAAENVHVAYESTVQALGGTATPQSSVCSKISQQVVGTAEWVGGNFKLTFHTFPAAGCPIQQNINWKVEVDGYGIALGQFGIDPSGQDFLATEQKIASNSLVVITVDGREFLAVPDQTVNFDFIVKE